MPDSLLDPSHRCCPEEIIVSLRSHASVAVFLCVVGLSSFVHAAEFTRVAYDDAGVADKQPHLVAGGDWRFETPATLPDAMRTAAFGDRIEFGYTGLNPKAAV